ncbi:MAG: PDZ domain-containing protein [bacterium]|nr:MAG: PDZ domain-containing protein [bacterium]
MKKKLLERIFFIVMSLLFLVLGLIGINRSTFRPDVEFKRENRGNHVVVSEVMPGGIAEKSGLEKGDLLIKMNGKSLRNRQELEFFLISRKPGQRISFDIQRGVEKLALSLILAPKFGKRFIILNLLSGILFWTIGIFVYLNKTAEQAARVFYWGCMTIAIAIMMVWPGYPYDADVMGYILPTIFFILYPLTPALILYFTTLYPEEKHNFQKYKFLPLIFFSPSLIFIILLETSYLSTIYLKSLDLYLTFYHIYNLFRAYFILYLLISVGYLVHSYKISDTRESRKKIQWILGGICLGTTPFFIFWTFPQVLGFSPLITEEINYIFLLMIPLAIAFSIVKYQVLDIEVIINRGIVYALFTGVIISLYLVLVALAGHFFHSINPKTSHVIVIIFTLIAAVLFSPIRQRLQVFVDKTFYRVKYNYRLAINDFGKALVSSYNRIELIDLIIKKINAVIPVHKIALMLLSPSDKIFNVSGSQGMTEEEKRDLRFEFASELVQIVNSRNVPLVKKGRAELSDVAELPPMVVLDKIGIELLIPIALQEKFMGFLIMGKKLSEARFSEEDLELVSAMIADGFMALERLRLQEAMIIERSEREKLEELSKLKSEFISHVSHELRTPLTSINWSVENLLDGIPEKPSPKVKEYLVGIYNCSRHLYRMIENLLDITRIEAGKIEIYPERLNILEDIQKSLEVSKPLAESKDIHLEIDLAENLWIQADRDCLQAILTNLLDNAIKYSQQDDVVQIKAKVTGYEESKIAGGTCEDLVAISVVDHGAGIPKEKQKVIFERFERIKTEKTGREKGLGLGLDIVKRLVELQGGQIWVESKVGKGSIFTFTLPRG